MPSATRVIRNLERLRAEKLRPDVVAFEEDLRTRLGEQAQPPTH